MVSIRGRDATLDGYVLGKKLGEGLTAKVYHAYNASNEGEQYAIKVFKLNNPRFDAKVFSCLKKEVEATF